MNWIRTFWEGLHWIVRPYDFYESLARQRGRTAWAGLPGLGRVLITGQPEVVGEIATHPDLVGGRAHSALRAALGEDHLIVLWGEAHRRRRRIIFPALHNHCDDQLIVETTLEGMTHPFHSLHGLVHDISLKIMVRVLLGRLNPVQEEHILSLARKFQQSFSSPLNLFVPALRCDWGPWSPWGRLVRNRALLMDALVEQLHRSGARHALARALLEELEPQALPWELLANLMFGHETTAGALAWAFAHLSLHPDSLGPIADGDEVYIQAFLEESLRLCPAVAQLTRVAERPTCVGGHTVAAGTVVMPSISLSHRDPQVFSQPSQFCPRRFLGPAPSPRAYYPFGLGNRVCPGKNLAMRQMVLMVKTIVGGWKVIFQPRYRPRPVRQLFLVVPHQGVPAKIAPSGVLPG